MFKNDIILNSKYISSKLIITVNMEVIVSDTVRSSVTDGGSGLQILR